MGQLIFDDKAAIKIVIEKKKMVEKLLELKQLWVFICSCSDSSRMGKCVVAGCGEITLLGLMNTR